MRQGRIILLFDQLHSRLLLSDEAAADYTGTHDLLDQGSLAVPTQSPMSTNSKQGRNDFLLNTDIQYLLKTSTEYIVQVRLINSMPYVWGSLVGRMDEGECG